MENVLSFVVGAIVAAVVIFFVPRVHRTVVDVVATQRGPGEALPFHRPDYREWSPVCNIDKRGFRKMAYEKAAQDLGLHIKFADPVVAEAGDLWLLGMYGVYIKYSERDRRQELDDKMWDELAKLQKKYG